MYSWQATSATSSIQLAPLFGMPECVSVRQDEAKRGNHSGWHR